MTPVSGDYTIQVSALKPVRLEPITENCSSLEAKMAIVDVVDPPAWTASLFGCFSSCVPNCCTVCFCPCVSMAQISARLGESFEMALMLFGLLVTGIFVSCGLYMSASVAEKYDEAHIDSSDASSSHQTVFAVCAIAASFALVASTARLRSQTRAKFALPGSTIADCGLSLVCGSCVVAQLASQLQTFTPGSCQLAPPSEEDDRDLLPAYNLASL